MCWDTRVIFIFMLGVTVTLGAGDSSLRLHDYRNHSCIRSCEDGAQPMRCEYEFTVEWYFVLTKACFNCPFNKTDCFRPHCIPADGFPKGVIVVNRMLPGPAIQVCENDEIVVTVANDLNMAEGTSIHWHGLHQKGSPHNDGVEMLTQCPIAAHTEFQYRFRADNPGTHFWHSHAGLQRADGFFGAFIVRQPPADDVHFDKYDFDLPEHYMIIGDWLTETSVNRYTHHHHDDGDNKPKSMLINGMGAYQEYIDPSTNQTVYTPKAEFKVSAGKRYRFRVISNGILNCPIIVSIDNHTLEVIATDGAPFEPFTVDSLVMYAGERYDFILTTNNTVTNYWIRLQGLADCGPKFFMAKQTAILRYDGAPEDEDPAGDTDYFSNSREGKQLNPLNTRGSEDKIPIARMNASFPDEDISGTPDKKFYIGMDFYKIDNKYFHDPSYYPVRAIQRNKHLYTPQFNHITMKLPPSPPLTQLHHLPEEMFCNEDTVTTNCTENHCECVHTLKVKLNDLVEVVFVDEGVPFNANHPIHLHGYAYRVVGMDRLGESTSVAEVRRLDEAGQLPRNLETPPRKDTVTVPDGGYTIFRFRANNPGFWFMHCHIAFHAEIGMGAVVQVGEKEDFPKVPENFPTCGNYRYTGNVQPDDDDNEAPSDKPCKKPIGFWFMHCHIEFHAEIGMGAVVQVGEKEDFPKVPESFPTCGNYRYTGNVQPDDDDDNEAPSDKPCKKPIGGASPHHIATCLVILATLIHTLGIL